MTIYLVGESLFKMRQLHSTSLLADRPQSRASSLPQGVVFVQEIAGTKNPPKEAGFFG
jgi:hypothetical protein